MVKIEEITVRQIDALKELSLTGELPNLNDVLHMPVGICQDWILMVDYIGNETYAISKDGEITGLD